MQKEQLHQGGEPRGGGGGGRQGGPPSRRLFPGGGKVFGAPTFYSLGLSQYSWNGALLATAGTEQPAPTALPSSAHPDARSAGGAPACTGRHPLPRLDGGLVRSSSVPPDPGGLVSQRPPVRSTGVVGLQGTAWERAPCEGWWPSHDWVLPPGTHGLASSSGQLPEPRAVFPKAQPTLAGPSCTGPEASLPDLDRPGARM